MNTLNKIFSLLTLYVLLVNCSSNNSDNSSTFSINLVPSATNAVVDQEFSLTINANETITGLWASTNNFATGGYAYETFGSTYVLRYNFDTLGQKIISIRCQNQNNDVSEKKITINVTRGYAIKILGVQIVSFSGINTVFDPEYPATNPESLADLRFGFSKILIGSPYQVSNGSQYNWRNWYQSQIIPNQGNMSWDCSTANLYIDPSRNLRFGLSDIDNGIGGADLLNGPPDYREISFSNYLITKPTTITYSFPEINLEFKVLVEWAN